MADEADQHDSVGAWAKKYHLTSHDSVESTLREHDLGPTQWSPSGMRAPADDQVSSHTLRSRTVLR